MGNSGKKTENLHDGHRQRMRKRFIETGFNGFEQYQILEMLLFYACPRKDTNELAHILIDRFGSLSGVFDADLNELIAVNGITENAAVLFKMIPKCIPVYYEALHKNETYENTDKIKELFKNSFIGLTNEQFRLASFDNELHLIGNRVISDGSPSAASVDIRKIVEICLRDKTSLVAVSHNHPNGSPNPTDDDIYVTRKINNTLKAIGITLLDHIIVGESQVISLRDSAYLNMFE